MTEEKKNLTSAQILALSPAQVVEQFKNFVYNIVNKIHRSLAIRINIEDLESYGMLGLLEAHSRFDSKTKHTFTTYAYYRVRGAILDGCRKEGWIPRERKKKAKQLRGVDQVLETEVEERAGAGDAKTFSDAVSRVADVVSSAAVIVLMEQEDLQQVYDEAKRPEQHQRIEKHQTRLLLLQALDMLDDDERDIVIRFHFESERMDAIGESYGCSKSWISRVHKRALKKLYFQLNRFGVESSL